MDITSFAFKNKALIFFLLFILVVGGIFSFLSMSKLEDPEIKVKQALVVTLYPGASAHQVELEVTDVLEKAIATMGDIKQLESRSMADYSEILVELNPTVRGSDIEQKWDMLRRKVVNAQASLPEGARESMVVDDFGDVYGLFYAMTSDGFSYEEMSDYADLVKRELESLSGVKRVEVFGKKDPCINIAFREDKMANLGVMPLELLNTFTAQNKTVYSGYFNAGDHRLRVSVNDGYAGLTDVAQLVIQGHEQDQVRLGQVADISRGYVEPHRNQMRYNRLPALGIAISMEKGGNIVNVGELVDARLGQLKSDRVPAGIEFEKVFFQPEKVSFAIRDFMINLLESVAIVVVILMFTMGFRSGVIIGGGLVVTVLGSFLVLNFFDGTLQRVSLASLIVAMGMLVDNAIVIVDGILVDLKRGMKMEEALLNTPRKTALPLLGATLIAIFAFLPIFLSPDTSGEYVRDLFIVLAVSLLLSWLLALTHTPIYAAKRFKSQAEKQPESDSEVFNGRLYKVFGRLLDFVLYHKLYTISITLGLLLLSGWLFTFVKQGFFPDLSYNQLYIEYKADEGVTVDKVKKDLISIEDYLLTQEQVENVTSAVGGTPARYNLVRSIAEHSTSYGELIVDFKDPEVLKESIPGIQTWLNETFPHAFIRVKRYNLMYKKFPIEALFTGPDPAVLKSLADQAKEIMRKNEATWLVTDDWEPMSPVLVADYSQPSARVSNLSRSDVSLALLAATDGLPVGNYYEGKRAIPMYLKSVASSGQQVSQLDRVPVWSMIPNVSALDKESLMGLISGRLSVDDLLQNTISSVPLSQATKGIEVAWEEPVVRRYNGQRAIKAQCNNAPGFLAEDARRAIAREIEAIELPVGYTLKWQGEKAASSDSMSYLFMNLPLAVVLIIAMLIALFRDYRKPGIILLSFPVSFIGIVLGMLISGKEFGFVAIVGALGLMGMMIKNGVVLIEEIELQINGGKPAHQALLDSSASRLRPVMMASLTTILGMLPLLPDDMFGALSVTIMSGLLLGTITTLILVPVLYAAFYGVKHPRRVA